MGGRNTLDIADLFCYDAAHNHWTKCELAEPLPKPRRRHSSVFIASSLLVFGGFDGGFYNDMHILHTNQPFKSRINVSSSTHGIDLAEIVN
jgi:hypothetical protein